MQAQLTLPPEFESQLKAMIRETVSEMIQNKPQQTASVDFLNLGQAANYIQVSRGTLNKMIKQGQIHVAFIGAAKRISKAELLNFMTQKSI